MQVRARMLVIADGATSKLATKMGYCKAPPKVCLCLHGNHLSPMEWWSCAKRSRVCQAAVLNVLCTHEGGWHSSYSHSDGSTAK